jgi:hypothetical protein
LTLDKKISLVYPYSNQIKRKYNFEKEFHNVYNDDEHANDDVHAGFRLANVKFVFI